jgi:hypothetical protein
MLYWALRWHEGRKVSYRVLGDVLWGEFALKPKDPVASLRELMASVQKRHRDKWDLQDCYGTAFRILPRREETSISLQSGKHGRVANENREL